MKITNMEIISKYIAPWAIANEEFPLHLIWKPNTCFDSIEICISPELVVNEVLNVQNWEIANSKVHIKSKELLSPDYFGLILRAPNIFLELRKKLPIKIIFYNENVELDCKVLTANIVRPKIGVVNPVKQVTITEDTDLTKLFNFQVVHKGLGKVKVDLTAKAQGNIISQSDSLYFEVLEEIVRDLEHGELEEDGSTGEDISKMEISLDPIELQETTRHILERIEKGNFPNTVRKKMFQQLAEDLKDDGFRDRLIRVIYSKIQRMFLSYILYYFDRNPHEDVDLPVGKIKVNLDTSITAINLEISYTDSYNNQYETIRTNVDINDERVNKKFTQIPINIDWKDSSLILRRQLT